MVTRFRKIRTRANDSDDASPIGDQHTIEQFGCAVKGASADVPVTQRDRRS
jgi:hypothetical protein